MTLDEAILKLRDLRRLVGGGMQISTHPRVFDSERPTIASAISVEAMETYDYINGEHVARSTNVVVIR